jgi:hypothetical protein
LALGNAVSPVSAATNSSRGLHLKFLSIPQTIASGDTLVSIRVKLLGAHGLLIKRKGIRVKLLFLVHGHTPKVVLGRSSANGIVSFRGFALPAPHVYTVRAVAKGFHRSEAHKVTVLG